MRPIASLLAAVLLPISLGACANMAVKDSPPPSAELQRQYDKTLTKAEQEAAISDLQKASNKGEATGAANTAATTAEHTN